MAKFVSNSAGDLVLPNGETIKPGAEVDLKDDATKNLGVQAWIKDGLLVALKSEAKKVK
ncbi:hypothetical protein [Halovulum sp. GXIMD14793]